MQRIAFTLVLLLMSPLSLLALLSDFSPEQSSGSSTESTISDVKGCPKAPPPVICDHKTSTDRTFLVPFRFVLNPRRVSPDSAIAVIGEVGFRTYRINGTLGVAVNQENRFKVTAEYLVQNLDYNFTTGKVHRWIQQVAFGGAYEYFLNRWCIGSLEADFFYSHAFSRRLSSISCNDNAFSVNRRIAGGRDYGFAFGGNVFPWYGAKASFYLNYDHVVYHRKFSSNHVVKGAGASVAYYQKLFYNLDIDLKLEYRRPFNYFFGLLRWNSFFFKDYGDLKFGVFYSYTKGKSHLPSTNSLGFQIDFSFGVWGVEYGSCNAIPDNSTCCQPCLELADWITRPAVFMPQVLAIAEEQIVDNCTAVPVSFTIPNQTVTTAGSFTISLSEFFVDPTGIVPLTFSATGLPDGTSICSTTGEITGINLLDNTTHLITVTASNPCGSTTQSFTLTFSCSGVPPISSPIQNQIVNANGPYTLDIGDSFSDPTGKNPLTFSAVGLIAGTIIDPTTGEISGTNPADNTTHTVVVTATNSCGSTNQQFNITYTCLPPTSQAIPNQSFGGSPVYSFEAGAFFTDVTGTHPLTFSATGLPAGSTINPLTGTISGTNPRNGSTVAITVTATNTCGSTSQTFTITFLCSPPTSTPIATQTVPGATGAAYSINVSGNFTDPSGVNPLTFIAVGLPVGSTIGVNNGIISGTVPAGTPVMFTVQVTATNVCGSTSQSFTLSFPGV